MTETVDAGEMRTPGADAWQRAGLTRGEAVRRERVDRWRAETQSPWEAGLPGLIGWLLWRTLFKGLQPLWLITSLALALWFSVQWLGQTGGLAAHVEPQPGEAERLSVLVAAAVPEGADARRIWQGRLEDALRGDERRRADIDRFRSWAALGPDLIGRERLALESLAGAAGPRALDAELRAGPAWQRRTRLEAAWQSQLARGEALDLDPPALIFAPEAIRQRAVTRGFAWAVANTSADGFFRGDHRGQFELRSVPGLVTGEAGDTRLYGGVRDLVIQLCAGSGSGPSLRPDGCDSPIIPPAAADSLALSLAAIEAGMVELPGRSRAMVSGAEILIAARRAGRLDPGFEAWLAGALADLLPAETVRARLVEAGVRPDVSFAAPSRVRPQIESLHDARTAPGAVELATLLQQIDAVRSATSSFEAIRLMVYVDTPDTLAELQRLSALAGPASLAVMEWLGATAYQALVAAGPRPAAAPGVRQGLILALGSAAFVLLLTLIRITTPDRLRRASRTSLTDAWMSRLLLGRKI
ncbi:hypothetical protein AWH62_03945 [Maricaulis sp. W15]|uniref:hypothetical protein n=1 Tax=Maricaulis sp. W15 TaxID=1772333 RepID=UPI000948CA10|nr:hypothetical protein [Maricaulis sp. W15]OLF77833.1 hypothetical protein AWH62_03945 [Maricaulis sp. W15]